MKFASRVAGVEISMIRQVMLRARDCANLGIGEPDDFPPDVVRHEAARLASEEKLLYSPNVGTPELCRAVCDYHDVDESYSSCITNGSQEALFDLLFTIVERGDEVLIPDPGFPAYRTVVEMAGAEAIPYPLNAHCGFKLQAEQLAALRSARTRAIIVNSPSNPTGQVFSRTELTQIADMMPGEVWVISDEIYRDIYFDAERPATMGGLSDRVVLLSGVSKMAAMTGWRLGWLCGPKELVSKATVMHQYTSSSASTLAQKAALPLFTDEGRRQMASQRQRIHANRDLLAGWLKSRGLESGGLPRGAFYYMLPVDSDLSDLDLALGLIEFGVAVIPGSAFGEQGRGHLRLSFAVGREEVCKGLDRLSEGLNSLTSSPG